jgi:hypothetical protein
MSKVVVVRLFSFKSSGLYQARIAVRGEEKKSTRVTSRDMALLEAGHLIASLGVGLDHVMVTEEKA